MCRSPRASSRCSGSAWLLFGKRFWRDCPCRRTPGYGSFCKGCRAREERIAVGIISVVPTEGGAQVFADRLVDLDTAINGIFLIPNDSALDVEILVGKRGLGAHQRGKRTDYELRRSPCLQLNEGDRNRPIKIAHGILGANKRRGQRRHGINAGLDEVLKFSVRFLNEDLTVAQSSLGAGVSRHGIVLEQRVTGDDAVDGQLAQWSGVKGRGRLPCEWSVSTNVESGAGAAAAAGVAAGVAARACAAGAAAGVASGVAAGVWATAARATAKTAPAIDCNMRFGLIFIGTVPPRKKFVYAAE